MFDTTKHAATVIAARKIKQEWIDSVLQHPILTQPDPADVELEHRLAVIADYGDRVLRVVCKRETAPVMVITAYFDRTMKGKL
ncbi:MAG: DUF4258 domain-containing protein [Betaproteobacteria bacterium]|nr:DUF4258 domain-containing protein [Betaproteobacteria bacterium]